MMHRLDARGYLRNTMLVFFTDHGQRTKHYAYGTELGKLERYLPFVSIRLPPRSPFDHTASYRANLLANSNKLVSFFDLHQTLRHFLHINTNEDKDDKDDNNKQQQQSFRTLRGISLFERVPLNRSCRDAIIPLKCCSCFRPMELSSDELVSETGVSSPEAAARIAIDSINELVASRTLAADHRDCVPFALERIVAIKRMQIGDDVLRIYVLTIVAQPGDAWFDAQLRLVERGTLRVQSVPARLSRYGTQSHCVSDDSLLANYCFCRDMLQQLHASPPSNTTI